LRQIRCPVLALNGEKDLQVAHDDNLPGIRQALADGGNRDVETVALPGLNHLFQTAATGAPSEYGQIAETFAPAALEKVSQWILQRRR
jgi:pimeloyl-ACP methyl ester carboxylesterase